MSVTRYYTGAEEISAYRGDFSTTDSITPNYEDGWADIVSSTFSVPSSGNLPSGIPGDSDDVDLSDANVVQLVTVRIKDTYMLSAKGDSRIPSYPFCIFPSDFNVLKGWSGVLYRGQNTDKIGDYGSEADAKADATLARPDTWVWYGGKWVSLIGNNPEDTFYKYGTNSSGQAEYFQHRTVKESGAVNDDLRYVEQARVRLSKSTISKNFVTTYNGIRCAMMLLIPFKATKFTQDAVGLESSFSSSQVFYAVDDIGGTLFNVDSPNTIPPTYYNTQDDGTEWTRLPDFDRNVSNAQSDMPYFKKAKTYTYLTAFNVADDDKFDIRKCFRSSNMGDTEYIISANWIVPYQRIYSRSVPESTSFWERTFYYVYWNDERGEWDISESQVVASTEKRLLGVILQAPGGNGGPGTGDGGGAGGGGGAYGEFLVNAYNKYIRVTLSKPANTGDDSRATAAPSEIEVSDGTNRIQMQCTAGMGGTKGTSKRAQPGKGGEVQFSTNGGTSWSAIVTSENPIIMQPRGMGAGDRDLVRWYSPSGRGTFSWDVACIGIIAAVRGCDGGKGGGGFAPGTSGDNGATLSIIRGYDVTGVPSKDLRWSKDLEHLSEDYKPHDAGSPGNNAGNGGAEQEGWCGGGGGGASFYGKGGRGDTYTSNPHREKGVKGGGSGGSAGSHTGWEDGSSGVLLLLK